MRKLGWIVGIVIVVGAVAAGGGWLARHAIVAEAARWVLADRGVSDVDLTVEQVETGRIVVRDLRLGGHGELAVRELDVRFDPWAALTRGLVDVAADGLTLTLDATGDGPLLGDLQVLLERREAGAGGRVPPLAVSDGRIVARTPAGAVTVAFDGTVIGEESGSLVISAMLDAATPFGDLGGEAAATVDPGGTVKGSLIIDRGDLAYEGLAFGGLAGQIDSELRDGDLGSLTGTLRAAQVRRGAEAFGGWNANLNVTPQVAEIAFKTDDDDQSGSALAADVALRVDDYRQAPALTGRATVRLAGPGPWQVWTAPATWDRARLETSLSGTLLPLAGVIDAEALLAAADLSGDIRLAVDQVGMPNVVEAGTLSLQADTDLKGGQLSLRVREGSTASGRVANAVTATLSQEIRPLIQDGIEVFFGDDKGPLIVEAPVTAFQHPTVAGPLRISGTGADADVLFDGQVDDAGLSGDVDLAARAAAVAGSWGRADGLDLSATALVTAGRNGQWSAVATEPGEFSVQAFAGDAASLRQPLTGTLDNAMVFSGAGTPVFSAAVTLPDLAATLPDTGDVSLEDVRVQAKNSGQDKALDMQGKIAALDAPGLSVAAQAVGFEATGIKDGNPREAALTIGVLRDTHEPAFVVPVKVTATLSEAGAIRVAATDAWQRLRLTYDGERKLGGDIAGTYQVETVKFDPEIFEITEIFPFLDTMREVRGTVAAGGRLGVVNGQPDGSGWLDLDGLSATVSGVALRGLTGRITADSLFPPRLPPGQTLTISAVDPAIPLTGGEVRFHVPGTTPTVLVIERAGLDVAGGRVSLGETVIDPARPEQALTLQLDRIDLKQLLAVAPVEGLDGEGTLSGALPVAAGAGGWRVDHGALDAIEPGIIRFRSEAATAALQQGGEAVRLMLQALEDFRYEDLEASVDKDEDGSTTIGLSLLGHNPAVMDGHPFRFNINLEGNLNRVLTALRQGMALSDEIIRRGVGR